MIIQMANTKVYTMFCIKTPMNATYIPKPLGVPQRGSWYIEVKSPIMQHRGANCCINDYVTPNH